MRPKAASRHFYSFIAHCLMLCLFFSCSVQKQIARSAKENVLAAPVLQTAHVGISIYEPATNKYWYNYQGEHYFVPASNTKIPTCYAAMKYLGDSLTGLKYGYSEPDEKLLVIQPTGDPTLLHPDYKNQRAWEFFSSNSKRYNEGIAFLDTNWQDRRWGSGWSWNDYDADYMAERSAMPIYGNVINIKLNEVADRKVADSTNSLSRKMFSTQNRVFDAMVNHNEYLIREPLYSEKQPSIQLRRDLSVNAFWPDESNRKFSNISVPFVTGNADGLDVSSLATFKLILSDTFKFQFGTITPRENDTYSYQCRDCSSRTVVIKKWQKIHSQPTDSLLKPMMHRSDNFFAEQSLLMVSNEKLGIMNDAKIIDTLLKTDLKDLPQKPRWVDGSGLSRYNLFTPQDFVAILNKMKNEFGMERIKVILPTGGEGTISSYFKTETGFIFVKTGTLSSVVALSGFLYTRKNKLLIFSTLVNNHNGSATDVRRAMEKFLLEIRNKY